ncbi:DUF1800 domain-containing protein [Tateyamaria pelophila]|uniref:DUF1800 domain-containing protein n=1 Tax=Tateyamaria pelophila TaxID=328415 RepID=UPI002958911E|nr:DUF1800 domain-containing protein [Tateyamaria pelophila]
MLKFDPQLAEIRFGYGLSPLVPGPASPKAMLDGLRGPDEIVEQFPIEPFTEFQNRMVAAQKQGVIRRKKRGTPEAEAAKKQRNLLNKDARIAMHKWLGQTMLRRAHTKTAFRERLVAFWADHFTALGKSGVVRRATSPYIEDAIRPHISGRFGDLLQAAVMHPLMLSYLDQTQSMGPLSERARKMGPRQTPGLNENLAREVMELHTLGVGGPYSQQDVTQLAELFTGMTFQPKNGFKFRKDFVEPGAETILGKSYPDAYNVAPVRDVLNDLAAHPATMRHIARKLAVHFVSDSPDEDLVRQIEKTFEASDGDLMSVYEVLIGHPSSWDPELVNYKPPIDFISSAVRALGVPASGFEGLKDKDYYQIFINRLVEMGQPWERPPGPDGWPEEDQYWITPQGLATRVQWAMGIPIRLVPALPDPREFAVSALGDHANETVRFAASAAESKREGIGLVLMSPQFQRR